MKTGNNVTIGHYILGKALGKGTFGHVKQGTHILTGEKVAVKILEKEKINDQKDVERITREIKILKKVRHPNVIQLYEIIETEKELFMIMENANGGELFDYIVRHTRLAEKQAAKFYCELIAGIEYLHKSGMCHRDLKPENLLLDFDNTLKIVDFGLSNMYEKNETLKTACGSPCYAAPEMIQGKRYNGLQTDIWSSGVVFYAMVAGYLPFEDPKTSNLYKKIMSANYQMPKFLSQQCKDLISKILNTDPETRFRISDIRSHPFMREAVKDFGNRTREPGLFPGLQKMPYSKDLLAKTMEDYSFEEDYSIRCLEANRHNHITATYHLINKKNTRNQYMRETFSTHKGSGSTTADDKSKRERLQSQQNAVPTTAGASTNRRNVDKANTIVPGEATTRGKANDELNQTGPINLKPNNATGGARSIDNNGSQNNSNQAGLRVATTSIRPGAKPREVGSEAPKTRRDNSIEQVKGSGIQKGVPSAIAGSQHPAQQTANGTSRAKHNEQIIRSRITKQSQSPDKYHINNNLVVQLADPIRKPDASGQNSAQGSQVNSATNKKMYATSYKVGGTKASFFPSTATATTNGTSQADSGSNDPRRQTAAEGTRGNFNQQGYNGAKPQSRQNPNNSFELNLPLRFGKNQIKRSIHQNQAATVQNETQGAAQQAANTSQTTKNAWQAIEFNQTRRDVNGTFVMNGAQNSNQSTANNGGQTVQQNASQVSNGSQPAQQSIFIGPGGGQGSVKGGQVRQGTAASGTGVTGQPSGNINQVNISTKLQQQLFTLPDAAQKNSQSVKARHSPRDYTAQNGGGGDHGAQYAAAQQRQRQFYNSIQGKGLSIHAQGGQGNGHMDQQKKSILSKLFKGGGAGAPNVTNAGRGGNVQLVGQNFNNGVNSSFNEQLMNQTNFGFNPARQTIVSQQRHVGHDKQGALFVEPINVGHRRELNTQKRNRTQTIQIDSNLVSNGQNQTAQTNNPNMHQRGNSLNIHELYAHYQNSAKAGGGQRGGTGYQSGGGQVVTSPTTRIGNHQQQQHQQQVQHPTTAGGPNNQQHYQQQQQFQQQQQVSGDQANAGGQNGAQLFVPGAMKMQMIQRKAPVTSQQQHRSHSVTNAP